MDSVATTLNTYEQNMRLIGLASEEEVIDRITQYRIHFH